MRVSSRPDGALADASIRLVNSFYTQTALLVEPLDSRQA